MKRKFTQQIQFEYKLLLFSHFRYHPNVRKSPLIAAKNMMFESWVSVTEKSISIKQLHLHLTKIDRNYANISLFVYFGFTSIMDWNILVDWRPIHQHRFISHRNLRDSSVGDRWNRFYRQNLSFFYTQKIRRQHQQH